MKNIVCKIVLTQLVFILLFSFGQSADAQRYRRGSAIDTQYQEQDTGRSRVRTSRSSEITNLEGQNKVLDLRIPVLFGVVLGDLYDSWGDARDAGRTHEGIDILAPRGQFIVSPTDAVVTTVDNGGNGGNHVFTTNPGGERYYYAHLDAFAPGIKEGDVLKSGDLIGYVGNTGNAAGGVTHLHFGIYTDSGATNPFPRLTKEFTAREKVEAFIKIFNGSTNSTELARGVISENKDVFLQALIEGVKLPSAINEILIGKRTELLGVSRILKIGMMGDDIKALQAALGIIADGSFGPKTKAAVVALQIKSGIPADGVFGVSTRLALANSSLVPTALPQGCTSTTTFSPITGAQCIPVIVIPLPAGCTASTAYSPTTGAKCRPN